MYWKNCLLLAAALTQIASVPPRERSLISGQGDGFRDVQMRNVTLVRDRDGSKALRLTHNQPIADSATDLLCRFDWEGADERVVDYGNYPVVSRNCIMDKQNARLGKGCARFIRPGHRLVLRPGRDALLAEPVDMGSFTIAFWLYPYANDDGDEVMRRFGPYLDEQGAVQQGGMRLSFRSSRLVWHFSRVFRDRKGQFQEIRLVARERTLRRRWQHVAISYDHFSGKLTFWINGSESRVQWATDSGRFGGSPLIAVFPKRLRAHLVLAPSFRGKLDALHISRVARASFSPGTYSKAPGVALSPVHDLGAPQSRLLSLSCDGEFPGGSAVLLEYRLSDTLFGRDFSNPAWVRIRTGQTRFLRGAAGRYLQWRAILLGTEQGRYSPLLSQVTIRYRPSATPHVPQGLQAEAGDGRIRLRWEPNTGDVDGYRIYIGTEKGEYLLPGSPINIPLARLDTNSPEYTIYGLENDRLYYICITAYRNLGPGTQSTFSREVQCRPELAFGN